MKPSWKTYLKRGVAQFQEYGVPLLYYRFWKRHAIFQTPPLECPPESELEVHMQVCQRDWLNGLWTVRSFAHFVKKPFRLVVLGDGSISGQEHSKIKQLFPGVVIPDLSDVLNRVEKEIEPSSPTIAKWRKEGVFFTLPKVVDSFLYAHNQRVLTVDPDVLFFDFPKALLEAVEGALGDDFSVLNVTTQRVNTDGCFCIDEAEVKDRFGFELPLNFGIGLGAVNREGYDWGWLESVFREVAPDEELAFMLDQTITALLSVRFGWKKLDPSEYAIEPVSSLDGIVARHYYSKTRDLFYVEGIGKLASVLLEQ